AAPVASAPPSTPSAIPGLPATAAQAPAPTPPAAAAAPAVAPRPALEPQVETPRLRPAQRVPDPRGAPPASEAAASVSRAPAHVLNFALGNQLAQQNRWAEAQQEYFKAYTAEPDNADFAYNVAVSLDHLRQPRQALDYYQRAIGLSEKRGASFDVAAARLRAATLARCQIRAAAGKRT